MKLEGGKYKGGILRAKAESLEQRRTPLIPGSYHVPSSFDAYHHSVPRSEESGLRKLIVQEMLEMCGDLYPDINERSVILGATCDLSITRVTSSGGTTCLPASFALKSEFFG